MGTRIYRSDCPPTNYPTDVSISQFLIETNPECIPMTKIILEDNWTGKFMTYGGLRTTAAQGAWGLRKNLRLRQGDVTAIICPNAVDWVLLAHSVLWDGGVVAPINHMASASELVHYLQVCTPKVVAVSKESLPKVLKALSEVTQDYQPRIITLCARHHDFPLFPEDVCGKTPEEALPPLYLKGRDSRQVPAFVLFSSGTTGNAKGAYLSHHGIISHLLAARMADPEVYNGGQREVFFPPLCHLYGLNVITTAAVWLGNYTILMKSYNFEEFIKSSSKIKCTWMHILPPVAVQLVKNPIVQKYNLKELKTIMCSGSPLGDDMIRTLKQRAPEVVITQKYGSTEVTVTYLKRSVASERGASIGKLYPDMEARIVDDNCKDVEPGRVGELLVRGTSAFMGYKDNKEATEETLYNGWIRTGDLVWVDDDEFFYITGRKKELIKYKGFQVAPTELEELLVAHPLVEEAGVCGWYDSTQATELPVAYVTLTGEAKKISGRKHLLDDIRSFVDERVASYKKLRGGIFVLHNMPKTSSGKILRRALPTAAREPEALTMPKL